MSATTEGTATGAAIRPFTIPIASDAELDDLRARISATRWPERELVSDDSQGAPLAMMQDLARYWAAGYGWRRCEARLSELPNFVTEIDGLDIHFLHIRSQHEDALPPGDPLAAGSSGSRPSRSPPAGTRSGSRGPGPC